jgi:hypothetical protein
VGNLFDVKLRAINNLHEAGVEIVLVTTLVNGINNDQVGSIIASRSIIQRRSRFYHSSRFHLPAGTKRLPRNGGYSSVIRFRTSRNDVKNQVDHRTDTRLVSAFIDGRLR